MKVILSTRNPSKVEQIRPIFAGMPISILTLTEIGVEGEAVEDGETLQDNALKKAFYAFDHLPEKTWVMAEDTGLFINALGGKPGIRAARWAGEDATTEEIMRHTLKVLEGAPDRSATFEALVALISPLGESYLFSGKVHGTLLEEAQMEPLPKMPYSSIFQPEGETKVWAEMSVEHMNRISHRGKAFRQVREFFERFL